MPDDADDEDSVIVFGSGGERQFSIREEGDLEAPEVVADEPPARGGEPTTDEVLRALVNILVDKGILTREELLRRLR